MNQPALQSEMNMQVQVRLLSKQADGPLHHPDISVHLYDRDFVQDCLLGKATPDADGVVRFYFSPDEMNRGALEDRRPDFFFIVYRRGTVVYQSPVMENVDIESVEQYKKGLGEIIDLGTFLVNA
jgi:hypothetical protein